MDCIYIMLVVWHLKALFNTFTHIHSPAHQEWVLFFAQPFTHWWDSHPEQFSIFSKDTLTCNCRRRWQPVPAPQPPNTIETAVHWLQQPIPQNDCQQCTFQQTPDLLHLYMSFASVFYFCCVNTALLLWLGLGTKDTLLGFGIYGVLA